MRIGKKRAKFTIRLIDNYTGKTKSFVYDNSIQDLIKFEEYIKNLLLKAQS